jgi:hypothetical protein
MYVGPSTIPTSERFLALTIPEPNSGCLLWLGTVSKTSGYGNYALKKYRTSAHRASYILFKGEIPDGTEVCHTCDVKLCVNPDHLFIGSRMDNQQDMADKGRGLVSRKHGLPRGVAFHRHCTRHPYQGRVTYRGSTISAGYFASVEAAAFAAEALRERLKAEYSASLEAA